MNLITLSHANTRREVLVATNQVYAIQYSDAHKCTHIISSAGAIIPVAETVEQVRNLLTTITAQTGKEL